jgi:hypothetical protein
MACDTATLIQNARCIDSCIPDGLKPAVLIYLAAVAAGVDPTDTNALMRNARCIDSCIPDGAKLGVLVNLLCSGGSSPTPTDCVNLEGAGDPT